MLLHACFSVVGPIPFLLAAIFFGVIPVLPYFPTSKKNLFSDVGVEKEQKQELGWRVSVLPIPAFHCTLCTCNTMAHSGGMQEWVIQIPSIPILVSVLFPPYI